MTRKSAVLAHGISFSVCSICAERLAGRANDLALVSRDRIQMDAFDERSHREISVATGPLHADITGAPDTARAEGRLQDDVYIGLMGTAADVSVPVGIADQETGSVMVFDAVQDRISVHLKEYSRMLASISHDLQTPITRMRLRVEKLDESTERKRIVDDLREMEQLVRQCLSYSRGTLGGAIVRVKTCPVSFLESLVSDYQDTGRPVTLLTTVSGPIMTCPQALRRVLGNLIDNAIKYGGAAEISAHRDAGGALCISVSDRGPGIPEGELESVLQPFYRAAASRNSEIGGAGLGLSITAQLISSLEGHLMLANRSGGGLTATITLP